MENEKFSVDGVLSGLKDFQRNTVNYVFDRLYGTNPTERFLVADEVGLGKTMVAKGIIAKTLEHLKKEKVKRIDIVYICSNASIAKQNVNRLKISGHKDFSLTTRLTMLPQEAEILSKHDVNFISFTPSTTFNLKNKGGKFQERIILYRMLEKKVENKTGLRKLLQCGVKADRWKYKIMDSRKKNFSLNEKLSEKFLENVFEKNKPLVKRLNKCCDYFVNVKLDNVKPNMNHERIEIIGELRKILAETCIDALEPDLVILDEFQRFKDLLDKDNEDAILAQKLFRYKDVRTLLLSATPYKMLSQDHDQDDDHYPDFLNTIEFLFDGNDGNGAEKVENLKQEIQDYRNQLFNLTESDENDMECVRDRLKKSLMSVMCRTERIDMTKKLDAMLSENKENAPIYAKDLDHAAVIDQIAQFVGARDQIDFWKSSPYLFNLLRNYDFRRRIDDGVESLDGLNLSSQEIKKQLLDIRKLEKYEPIEAANARLRVILRDTIEKGMWKLLWLPPTLSYSKPDGVFADAGSMSKLLVFSKWNVVPNAISALCSYEAERRMINESNKTDLEYRNTNKQIQSIMKFTMSSGRLSSMPATAWMMPSITLAREIDPLKITLQYGNGKPLTKKQMLKIAEKQCRKLIESLPNGEKDSRVDERWYWAAPAMLEQKTGVLDWITDNWVSAEEDHKLDEDSETIHQPEKASNFILHLEQLAMAGKGELELGRKPKDLARVLAKFSLASAGTCTLRALQRVVPHENSEDNALLSAAAKVSRGFIKLFNMSDTIALIQGGEDVPYWRKMLEYSLDGNIQSLLDEQIHILGERHEFGKKNVADLVNKIATSLSDSLILKTASVRVDELKSTRSAPIPTLKSTFDLRCRFALRFGNLQKDETSEILRAETVRESFNSPFRPFILASTSVGQEGLDFHTWCHALVHWNLPSNPVDLEQREGRIHRYKGYAVRKNLANHYGLSGLEDWDGHNNPWDVLFKRANEEKSKDDSDLIPYWIYEEGTDPVRIERRIPMLPLSQEEGQYEKLKMNLTLYRLVFGQPRQEDLLEFLSNRVDYEQAQKLVSNWRLSLKP